MPTVDIPALRKLLAEATPGPWKHTDGVFISIDSDGEPERYTLAEMYNDEHEKQDAALIVAAVNALPALLAELEALREIEKAARAVLEASDYTCAGVELNKLDDDLHALDAARSKP